MARLRRRYAIQTSLNAKADFPRTIYGGAGRDRTDDLKLAKLALSQLSYGPDLHRLTNPWESPYPAGRKRPAGYGGPGKI